MKAFLKNYHQSPRKVRLLAGLLKGKQVEVALAQLDFVEKRASLPVKKLIASAVANAQNNFNLDKADLYIKEMRVDKGIVMKRMMPGAHGRGYPLKHRTSHVSIVLDVKNVGVIDEKPKTTAKKVATETASPKAKKAVVTKKAAVKKAAPKKAPKK